MVAVNDNKRIKYYDYCVLFTNDMNHLMKVVRISDLSFLESKKSKPIGFEL